MNPRSGKGVYPAPRPAVRPGWRAMLLSAAFAGATFVVLPLFGLLSAKGHEVLEVRPAPSVVPPPPTPPAVRRELRRREREKPRPKLKPKPKLERKRQRIEALRARLSLGMTSLDPGMGDFSLEFGTAPASVSTPEDRGPAVFELAQLDRPPRPLVRVRPLYPLRAKQRGVEGFAELLFVVGADGSVGDVKVLRSQPEGLFEKAAAAAVRRWRFSPGMKGGRHVASRVRITLKFRLEE